MRRPAFVHRRPCRTGHGMLPPYGPRVACECCQARRAGLQRDAPDNNRGRQASRLWSGVDAEPVKERVLDSLQAHFEASCAALSQVAAAIASARLLAITASRTAYLASSFADSANVTAS
jgi:hypothetical protein